MYQYSHLPIDAIHTGNILIIGFPNAPLCISNTYVSPVLILPGLLVSQTSTGAVGITPVGLEGISILITDKELIISGNTSGSSDQILLSNHPSPIIDQGYPVLIYSLGNVGFFMGTFTMMSNKAYLIDIDAIGIVGDDFVGIKSSFAIRQSNIRKMSSITTSNNQSLQFTTIDISASGLSINFVASISARWTLKLNIVSI